MTTNGRSRTADGVELWWSREGAGPTVLLVPGRGDSSDVYPPELSAALVAAGCAVLRVDPRDTGLSGDGGTTYTLSTMADDLVGVMSAAGLDAVHVLALSMGGMITTDLAIRHRDRVASIVLLSAMSPDPDAGPGPRFFDGLGADPVLGTLASMGAPTPDDERWTRQRIAAAGRRAALRPDAGLRHQDAALRLGWPELSDLVLVAAPTLVVHGSDDLVLPLAHAHAYASGIPGAELHVVAGMGHLATRREWSVIAGLVAAHVTAASSSCR